MAGPLKLTGTNDLQEMTSAEQDYIEHVILADFAGSDTGVGTVSVNPASTTGLTLIGSFTDSIHPNAVGSHPVGTTYNTTVYNFYQDRQSASESLTRPLEWDGTDVIEQNDTKLNAGVIDGTQDNLVAGGLGAYALQASAPAGGTWTQKATITDTVNGGTTTTTYLWRKTAAASTPTTVRPMKWDGVNAIQEMTDGEIQSLTARFRNRVAVGIGQYEISTNAPTSGGTWVSSGSAFSDTRRTLSNVNYSNTFSRTFARNFTGSYIRYYSGVNYGTYSRNFTGYFTGYYTGYFTGLTVQSATETNETKTLWVRTA
jgi:hypothetical protein